MVPSIINYHPYIHLIEIMTIFWVHRVYPLLNGSLWEVQQLRGPPSQGGTTTIFPKELGSTWHTSSLWIRAEAELAIVAQLVCV